MRKISFFLIILVALWAVWPLFQPGYIPTHDGEFSIIRIWQYSKMMAEGFVFPRWAPDLNSGYGVPLFTFYYPLPYFVGSIFRSLGFSLVDSFKLTLAFSYFAGALLCFIWLKKLFNTYSATVGTLFFLTVPYWFVDMYVRGSVGEVMALTFLMTALASVEHGRFRLLAVSVAAIILSHNIAAILFLPLLIGYMFLRRKVSLSSLILGLSLSAFFWIPAILERQFVLGLSNFDFRDHFPSFAQLLIPSWGTGFSGPGWPADEMSQQLGVSVIILLVLSTVFLFYEKAKEWRKLLIGSLVMGFVGIFLMLETSIPIWEFVRPLSFIQYPWRLLVLFIPLAGLLGAYVAERNRWIAFLVTLSSLFLVIPYIRPVIYETRTDQYYLTRSDFTDGTTTVGNSFSTVWLAWQKERPRRKFELESGQAMIIERESIPVRYALEIDATTQSLIRANISYYPGWKIDREGELLEIIEKEGRIYFWVPAGQHLIRLRFVETPLRAASNTASALSLFCLMGSSILNSRYERSNRRNASRKRAQA